MPFGLCNAASTFERIIEKTLAGLQWQIAVPYLDDIVVFGKSFEDHLCNLRKVFDRLSEAGLKLKPKKLSVFTRRNIVSGTYSVEIWHQNGPCESSSSEGNETP